MAAAVAAGMTSGEQRTREVGDFPGRDIGNDGRYIFVRPDIGDRDVALAERTAQGIARSLGHLQDGRGTNAPNSLRFRGIADDLDLLP